MSQLTKELSFTEREIITDRKIHNGTRKESLENIV